jgi:DNA ligase D
VAEEREKLVVPIDGRDVSISHPDKLLFPERGETKLDLIRYYEAVRDPLLATMGDRPVMLQRFPSGAGGPSFFQKRVPKNAPKWLETTTVSTPNGTESNAMVVADIAHVAWAVNLGCLGFHVWPSLAASPQYADELRIDLDPGPGVTFPMVQEAAAEVRRLLDDHDIAGYPKTTGSRGIHIYARLALEWDSYAVRFAAVAAARELERRRPDLMTAAWWKEERGERVFIDFNQNAPHKTVFGAWSVRAYPEAPVSMPFRWDELEAVSSRRWTIADAPDRLQADGDPWAEMYDAPQSIAPLLELHERNMAAEMMDAPWPPVYPKQPNEPPRVAPSRAKKVDPAPG